MSDRDRIKALLKEAELYRSQGLLEQSKEKYEELRRLIENHEKFSKDTKLREALATRINKVDNELTEVEEAADSPELNPEVQALISNLFSFAKNKEMAAIEGAVALAKFGQYEKAVEEFKLLIKEGTMPLLAAKNILRCHITLGSTDMAISQFKQWVSRSAFLKGDLNYLRTFLAKMLEKENIKVDLPQVAVGGMSETAETEEMDEEILEITSIGIRITEGSNEGENVEFDVTFQSGNKISVIIPSNQRGLAMTFKAGMPLDDLQCYSPLAVFGGKGKISGMNQIPSGPKKGDYALDITIESI